MSTRIPPRWIDPGIEGNERERTHPSDRFGESGQAESSIPNDPEGCKNWVAPVGRQSHRVLTPENA
jgi:hypothetical protein